MNDLNNKTQDQLEVTIPLEVAQATHGARMTQSEFSLFMEAIPFIERREAQGKAA